MIRTNGGVPLALVRQAGVALLRTDVQTIALSYTKGCAARAQRLCRLPCVLLGRQACGTASRCRVRHCTSIEPAVRRSVAVDRNFPPWRRGNGRCRPWTERCAATRSDAAVDLALFAATICTEPHCAPLSFLSLLSLSRIDRRTQTGKPYRGWSLKPTDTFCPVSLTASTAVYGRGMRLAKKIRDKRHPFPARRFLTAPGYLPPVPFTLFH